MQPEMYDNVAFYDENMFFQILSLFLLLLSFTLGLGRFLWRATEDAI